MARFKAGCGHLNVSQELEIQFREFVVEAQGFYANLVLNVSSVHAKPVLYSVLDYTAVSNEGGGGGGEGCERGDGRDSQQGGAAAAYTGNEADLANLPIKVIHGCLVSLGDLARYCCTLQGQSADETRGKFVEASRYYRQAHRLAPCDGTPHNQLGVLEGSVAPINGTCIENKAHRSTHL
jgi:hypothetical protein